ncbi:hypothetical protein TNCV_4960941 [Trichonephila clavipes]|uniref:Uncharacterized protein n=1 Tax=Trichonephila clavipes TaxID=2585209 RepID=A0A8X6SHD8_TRICX|nr:hypothetical protein TNCV_4960941 [Trichonephila clavipes]
MAKSAVTCSCQIGTQAHLLPSASSIKTTIPIESQLPEPISATAAAPDLLRGLNTSASSLSTETRPFPTTYNKFAALSTEVQSSVPLPESAATTSKSEPSNASKIHIESESGSKIILDFDRKSLAIQESQVEDIKIDDRNLQVDLSETKLNVVANVLDNNTIESIIGEKVNCAIIRDLVLSSRDQLIEEQKTDPELGHIYRYLENPKDSSVNAAICWNWSCDFRLVEGLLFYAKYATSLGEMRVYIPPKSFKE